MDEDPKQAVGAEKHTKRGASTPKADPPQVEAKSADTQADVSTDPTPEPAPEGEDRRLVAEWLGYSQLLFDVRPVIFRAAVADCLPEKKYTEHEIRRLIQRKLNEPA